MRMRRGIPLSQWVWLRELVRVKVVSGRFSYSGLARAAMKRALSSSDEASTSEAKKRKVTYATYQKWKSELDRDCQTVSWLDCESKVVAGKRIVSKLRCSMCAKLKAKIGSRRNFSDRWIVGANSVRTSNIRDHARADQHTHAMNLLKKEQAEASGSGSCSFAPIARALSHLPDEKEQLRRKFDIAYFIALEKLSFRKYPRLCELEARHGVAIGTTYTNEIAGKTFTHFIAESNRQQLLARLAQAKFFSLLIDGSTDTGNIDNELYMVVWCDCDGTDEKIHTRTTYFHVGRPSTVDAAGLFHSLGEALRKLGVAEVDPENCSKLVGIGSDGAAANIAQRGLKGLVEAQLEWVFRMWCFAHRLELAVKDALKGTAFDAIDDMLLKLYYLYEKSPKKCRELEEVIADLKECLCFDDSGVKPVRASGSRWVSHKLSAMRRILSKYGAYTNHLTALSQDHTVKSADRAKLHGYCSRWTEAKYLLGCAVFVDVLMPCAIFSKVMQSDELDILAALTSLLRTIKETEKLSSLPLAQWPVYSATLKKLSQENGKKVYQCQELKKFSEGQSYYERHYKEFCTQVIECLRSRMAWSDQQVIRDIISVLATQGWEKQLEEKTPLDSLDRLVERFAIPLQGALADSSKIREEFESILQYAVQFISLPTMDYRAVWWRIFHAPTASEWSNIRILVELLFSLPASNGKLERVFSQMNVIKTNKRSLLSNESLDDLLLLSTDSVPLKEFCPDAAIDLWWKDKLRRPNQKKRREYMKRTNTTVDSSSTSSSESEESDSQTNHLLLTE